MMTLLIDYGQITTFCSYHLTSLIHCFCCLYSVCVAKSVAIYITYFEAVMPTFLYVVILFTSFCTDNRNRNNSSGHPCLLLIIDTSLSVGHMMQPACVTVVFCIPHNLPRWIVVILLIFDPPQLALLMWQFCLVNTIFMRVCTQTYTQRLCFQRSGFIFILSVAVISYVNYSRGSFSHSLYTTEIGFPHLHVIQLQFHQSESLAFSHHHVCVCVCFGGYMCSLV